MAAGLLVFVVGVAITAFTVAVTSGALGIAVWGIILTGLGMFAKGLSTYWKTRHY
jgi:hypothetical protein